tara:strand:+ start:7387 stop:8007 length:621 start_codon:yes stop_codon:yes gene_type:complete
MAITTFAELKTAIANFLARSDLTDRIPEFIALAEARMSRELETRSQEKRSTANTISGDEFISLPTDLRKIRLVKLNTDPISVLDYASPTDFYTTYPSSGGGRPKYYTVLGAEIVLRPIPDSVYTVELIYGEEIAGLSDANTTNTILTRHPDAYLYGSLSASYIYLMEEARAAQYDTLFSRAIQEINDSNDRAFYSGTLSMKSNYSG